MATSTVLSSTSTFLLPNPNPNPKSLSSPSLRLPLSRHHLRHLPLTLHRRLPTPRASLLSPPPPPPTTSLLQDSTRTITSLVALAFSAAGAALKLLVPPPSLVGNIASLSGPLFFAAAREPPRGFLNTPLTVVAAGMSKWLDIYSGVLMVRVLLSWFPNIPWDRQPLSAIRDLCDPYLNLFRNIIPPVFDTLDVSPLLAFAVLGTLGSILTQSRLMY